MSSSVPQALDYGRPSTAAASSANKALYVARIVTISPGGTVTFAVLRTMTPAERVALGMQMWDEYRRRWMRDLREKHPNATAPEFREIVIAALLQKSEEELRIDEAMRRRSVEGRP